jgi:tetratricopeptide (TPR) repeat protein
MLGYLAVTLAHLGYIDQARSQLTEALAESRRMQHVYTQALVLLCANWTATIIGFAERKQHAEELLAVSTDDLPTFLGYGTAFLGLSLTAVGEAEEGALLLTQGLTMVRATGTVLNTPLLLMALADTHALLGRHADALNCLREAQRIIETTEERVNEAELRRLHGDLISRMGDPKGAEQMYHQAMAIARSQSAKLFELRAATRLARLWWKQGKKSAARDLLKPAYGWFTEGLDTPILRDALTLLEQLEEPK